MVDAVAVVRESADAVPLPEVADNVQAGCGGVLRDHRRHALAHSRVAQQGKRRNLVRLE